MSSNMLMLMAEFIHTHPEHQMQPPRVWQLHYQDECKKENSAYSFSALRQYPTLVRIKKVGRNNLYGSAKLPVSVMEEVKQTKTNSTSTGTVAKVASIGSKQQLKIPINSQPNSNLTPELALSRIEKIMRQATAEMDLVLNQLRTKSTKN